MKIVRFLAILWLACSIVTARAATAPDFAQGGTLRVCTNPTLPPITFVNGADQSDLAGFDIDLVRALARAWGGHADIASMDFEGMFPSLAAHRCDLVASGMMLQAGRERNYDAVPYLSSSAVVIGPAGAAPIASLAALSGKIVAIETGTAYARLIETENAQLASAGRAPIVLQLYPTEDAVLQQLVLGRVDDVISQDVEVYFRQRQLHGHVRIVLTIDKPDFHDFALYIRKDAPARAALEETVATLRTQGILEDLAHKWGISQKEVQQFAQDGTPSRFDLQTFIQALGSRAFLHGAALTLGLAICSHAAAIILSIPIALRLNGRPSLLRYALALYVSVFRAAPTLLQLLFVWNALPQFLPIFREGWFTPLLAAWLTLSVNECAYQVEINRAALRAVDPGQALAAAALGMQPRQIFRAVVFPQSLRIALSPTINEFISLLKTTSLASVISLQELLSTTQIQVARSFQFTEYYAAALVYYLVMVFAFLGLQTLIERRFVWADRNQGSRDAH